MTGPSAAYVVQRITGPVQCVARVPGSKSLTNRALICAALAKGQSQIRNLAPGDDSVAMLEILEALGIDITTEDDTVQVTGDGGELRPGPLTVSAGLAGTTSRFVTALCALGSGPYVIDGLPALRSRPMGPLHQALRDLGVEVRGLVAADHLPVEVSGPIAAEVTHLELRGDISSQYLSALMMIAPLLERGLHINLTSALVSRPYVELTAAVMGAFGAQSVVLGETDVIVGSGGYQPASYDVEPDASSASYPLAVVAICGGEVHIPGLGTRALQGDVRFVDLLVQMGCEVRWSSEGVWLTRDLSRALQGITVDMADISDLVPTMAVVAAIATTPTEITGVGFIRNKESDRLGDLVAELAALGVDATETADGLVVRPSRDTLRPAAVATHHDHRLAMAFAVLGTAIGGVEILDPGVVTKSWPEFYIELESWCSDS
jgi:3-phosphoshikimate 1-carboxyvinyltransferase